MFGYITVSMITLTPGLLRHSGGVDGITITKDDPAGAGHGALFPFASQYIVRSRTVGLIGAIVLTYERVCDFRQGGLCRLRVCRKGSRASVWTAMPQDEYYLPDVSICSGGDDTRVALGWVHMINEP